MPGYSSYRASNSAATKMFEYFGNEHPELRVVQVHPGLIRTRLTNKLVSSPEAKGWPWDDGISPSAPSPLFILLYIYSWEFIK